MKKLPFLTIVLLVITGTIYVSCKKEKDKSSSCSTDVASISGSYKIAAYTYKQTPTSPEEDWLPVILDACERDDVLSFSANGNYAVADVGVVCSPSGSDSGTWSLSGNSMNIDGELFTVESFDCKALALIESDINVPGDKIKITLTRQ